MLTSPPQPSPWPATSIRAPRASISASAAAATALGALAALAAPTTRPALGQSAQLIARSGAPAPGFMVGSTFVNFGDVVGPVINNAGHIAFVAVVNVPGAGIRSANYLTAANGANPAILARSPDPVPGLALSTINSFTQTPRLSNAGRVLLEPQVDTPSGRFPAILGTTLGSTAFVAGANLPPPGLPAPAAFLAIASPSLNDQGLVTFFARASSTGSTTADADGIWLGPAGALQRVLRLNGPVPGRPGASISSFPIAAVGINAPGQIATVVRATGIPGTLPACLVAGGANESGAPLQSIACTGDPASPIGQGITYSTLGDLSATAPLSDAGDVLLRAALAGPGVTGTNGVALLLFNPQRALLLWRDGQTAPGRPGQPPLTGVSMSVGQPFWNLNNRGQAVFYGSLFGTGVNLANDVALCAGPPGRVSILLREGDRIGSTAGLRLISNLNLQAVPLINDRGQILLRALTRPIDGATDSQSLILIDPISGPRIILAAGLTPNVPGLAPGLTVQDIATAGSVTGRGSSLSDSALLVARIRLSDNSFAIVRFGPFPDCPADYNADGLTNVDDLSDFITDYFSAPPTPGAPALYELCTGQPAPFDTDGYRADVNRDCSLNSDDVTDFITVYFNGC